MELNRIMARWPPTFYSFCNPVLRIKNDHDVDIRIPSDPGTATSNSVVRIEGNAEGVAKAKQELLDMVDKLVRVLYIFSCVLVSWCGYVIDTVSGHLHHSFLGEWDQSRDWSRTTAPPDGHRDTGIQDQGDPRSLSKRCDHRAGRQQAQRRHRASGAKERCWPVLRVPPETLPGSGKLTLQDTCK